MLSAHVDSNLVTREQLALVPCPDPTATHTPIAHVELVDTITQELTQHKIKVVKEEFAVSRDDMKLFGVMSLSYQAHEDYQFALGLRTSNNKTLPVQMIAGTNVFVCDNLAFSGELITLSRKHTSRIDIKLEIAGGVDRALQRFVKVEFRINELKAWQLKDAVAKGIILDAAYKKIMPLHLIPQVYKEYFEPRHEEFKPRNLWSLHNSFTESFKLLKPHVAMEANTELGRFFKM